VAFQPRKPAAVGCVSAWGLNVIGMGVPSSQFNEINGLKGSHDADGGLFRSAFTVSPPSVHQMVLTLERAGLIRRQPGSPRSIEVLVSPEQLPVLEIPNQSVKTSVSRY
jgi:hypothetical protein